MENLHNIPTFRQRLRSASVFVACLLLVWSRTVAAQTMDDRQLLSLVEKATQNQSDKSALRQVVKNISRYRELVAEGRVPKAHVEVLDNQIWDSAMRAWNEVQKGNPQLLRVDLVGSGGRRGEAGNSYIFGKSDLDFIPHAATPEAAEAAAAEFRRQLTRELGVSPQQIGVNALTPVTADERSLANALADPEKYPLLDRTAILEHQNYQTGMTLVWENGDVRRMPVRDLYAKNGWAPPPAPTAENAFGAAVSEGKFLDPGNGLVGVEKAIHDAKYNVRTLTHAVDLAGVELPPGTEALRKELQDIVSSKSVNSALSERIARHGGNVDAAIAEHLAETEKLQKQVTRNLLRNHFELLRDKVAAGGESLVEAQQSFQKVKQALATMKDSDARQLLKGLGISAENVDAIANEASARRIMLAREADRAAQESRNLVEALIRKLPSSEQAAARAQLTGIARLPEGKSLITNMIETMEARPVSSGLMIWCAIHEIQKVATITGEKGAQAGALAAGNAAADWGLMAVSPEYAVSRLIIDLGKLGVEWTVIGPIKEKVVEAAYSGDAGFLSHLGVSRDELTRIFSSEEEAVKASRKWYGRWMTANGEYLGKEEIEAAFYRQVRADFEASRQLQMARDASFDPRTGQYGESGFFRRVGNGTISFENFADKFPTEEKAANAIRYFMEYSFLWDPSKYGLKPEDRASQEEILKNYLLELWKASARHRDELKKVRADAERKLKEALGKELGIDELSVETVLRRPKDPKHVAIDRIRKAKSNWDALQQAMALLKQLQKMTQDSRNAGAEFEHQGDAAAADAQSLAIIHQQVTDDIGFVNLFTRRADLLRTAIKQGMLTPSSIADQINAFKAVQKQAEDISAAVDVGIASFKSGRIGLAGLRDLYFQLLQRYNEAKSQFKTVSEKYAMLRTLATLDQTRDECNWARLRISESLRLAESSAADSRSTAAELGEHLDRLVAAEQEFAGLKQELGTIIGHLSTKALDQGEADFAKIVREQLAECQFTRAPVSKALEVKGTFERNGDGWQELASTKVPPCPDLSDLQKSQEVAQQLLQDVEPAANRANDAMKVAERKLRELAAFLESKPTEVKPPAEPPPSNNPTAPPSPNPVTGTASVREGPLNNFVVEMEGMPANASFTWDFGDGMGITTNTPQVQHPYVAPTGGLAGLAGKRWQLSVTIKQGNRVIGTATATVSRGRLTNTPIGPAPK